MAMLRHSVALTDVDAAGVTLVNARGQLRHAVATEHTVELTEMWQAQIRQGPCIEAFASGEVVHAPDLEERPERWPDFVPLARAAGYRGAHAFPLSVRGEAVGALNLLARRPLTLDEGETTILCALADVATTALMTWDHARLGTEDLTTRTQAVLSGKAVFDTAGGMLAATARITPERAARGLPAYASQHHQRPTDIARALVERRTAPETVLDTFCDPPASAGDTG
ncbi:GAF and ANTAR domain-containing protein [Streptomyces sp. NPDC006529]|uniref:GAF and ANTAR domain-containing protein n=1 Tax=Streptomyces sp. NPDC006529 TaxID=3157177 RepID=UPI0033B6A6EF